jgi:putative iron-regulated protein
MLTSSRNWTLLLGSAVLAALASGCGSDDSSPVAEKMQEVVATYAEIAHETYQDSLRTAEVLDASISAMLAAPTAVSLTAAREAWLFAREPYLQTEVFRFYGGPIDDEETGPEGQINAWPLDEKYIDYTAGTPDSGIVNDTTLTIDAETLLAKNEEGGEQNIATGYHAIEFLLWGEDLSEDGPGDRPATDYRTEGDSAGANAERRGLYLSTVSQLLVEDLSSVTAAWEPNASNYRKDLLAEAASEGLRRILTGMIVLSGFETGGERLENAILTGEQNDEHSCFSDNTHRDMVQDVQGVLNVWQGRYERVDGTVLAGAGVKSVVELEDAALAARLDAKIKQSLAAAEALQPPFDNEIRVSNSEGRARVQALSTALREQEGLLQDVFRAFALQVPEDPM